MEIIARLAYFPEFGEGSNKMVSMEFLIKKKKKNDPKVYHG